MNKETPQQWAHRISYNANVKAHKIYLKQMLTRRRKRMYHEIFNQHETTIKQKN